MKYWIFLGFVILFIFTFCLVSDHFFGTNSFSDGSWSTLPSELILTVKDGRKIQPSRWKYYSTWDAYIYYGLYPLKPFEGIIENVKTENKGLLYMDITAAKYLSGSDKEGYIQSFSGDPSALTPEWFNEPDFDGQFCYSGSNIIFPRGVTSMDFYVSQTENVVCVTFSRDR